MKLTLQFTGGALNRKSNFRQKKLVRKKNGKTQLGDAFVYFEI